MDQAVEVFYLLLGLFWIKISALQGWKWQWLIFEKFIIHYGVSFFCSGFAIEPLISVSACIFSFIIIHNSRLRFECLSHSFRHFSFSFNNLSPHSGYLGNIFLFRSNGSSSSSSALALAILRSASAWSVWSFAPILVPTSTSAISIESISKAYPNQVLW